MLKRVGKYSAHTLTLDEVRRLDSVRMDKCSRCMPMPKDIRGTLHPALSEFYGIQRAFKDDEHAQWDRIHKARKVVALRLALEAAEAELGDPVSQAQADILQQVEGEARDGGYSPLEVTVQRR